MFLPSVAGATQPGDNGRIAFSSDRDGGNIDIYTMNPDGSGVVQLTDDAFDDWNSSWSPDGNKIAFVSTRAGGTHQVYVMNADGTSVTQLTDSPGDHSTPTWSPDGTQIAFTTGRDSNDNIYKMNADGSNETPLTDPSQNRSGAGVVTGWRQDRLPLGPLGCLPCYWEIFLMDPDGSNETELPHWDVKYEVKLSWAPDGRSLFITIVRPASATTRSLRSH